MDLETLKQQTKTVDNQRLILWSNFAELVFTSCIDDAHLAAKITVMSGAAGQWIEATIKSLRAIQEHTKAKCSISEARGRFTEDRELWLSEAKRLKEDAESVRWKVQQDFLRKQGSDERQLQVISEKLTTPLSAILEKWDELIVSLSWRGTFYTAPPSGEELASIVKVFGDNYRGHWYTCPNGHIFSIGNCGGAVQVGRCNECGAAIGGSGYVLASGNRDADFLW